MSGDTTVNPKRDSMTLEMKNTKGQEITTQVATTPLEDKMKTDEMDIEGVVRLILSVDTQSFVGFVIQRKITPEVSWTRIAKELLENHIALHGESSEFFEAQEHIKNFSGPELMIACSATLETENQFYLCVTERAERILKGILMRKKLQLERELENTIHKKARTWKSYGSEKDVDDEIVKVTRPLVEKEIAISISSEKMQILFQDDDPAMLNNGYVECARRSDIINVQRKRYSQGVQACPSVISTTAQTNPGFPTNVWTQYVYEPQISSDVLNAELAKNITSFQSHAAKIENMINYNEKIDLYENDYPELIANEKDTQLPETIMYEEYETFIDIKKCAGKMISCAVWHPTLSGVVAIAYVRQPQFLYSRNKYETNGNEEQIDKVLEDVFDENFVLIWSVTDKFSPKLYLESPREIHCLQFSPVNGNMLVGGLVNGQIIVWDIGEHLEGIQEISFTLELSSKNQRAIAAHLRWMKAKKPKTYIPPCAISSLQSSHTTCVMGIQWVSPFWHVTESGDFLRLKGSTRSQEFITCAHDGCVNFWDLKNMKAEMKIKSHPRKESARRTAGKCQLIPKLTPHFKVLTQGSEAAEQDKDLDGQPIGVPLCVMAVDYIHVPRKKEKTSLKSMKHLTAGKQLISYPSSPEIPDIKPKSDDDSLGSDKKDKQLKVTRKREITIPKSEVVVGSLEGVVTKIIWNDFDSDTEQTSGPQVGTFAYWGEVHDGPVTSLVRSPFIRDLVLSVGGKIFALWIESAKGNLLYRRKSSVLMTSGSWSVHRPSMFYITRIDGKMEIWDLFVKSDQDSFHQRLSGKLLTGVYPHIHLAQSIIGVADTNAQFRMLCVPSQHTKVEHDQVGTLHHLIQQEISRKESFIIWQKNWEERNAEMLKARKEAAELEAKRQEEAEREKARKIKEQKKRKQQQLEERKRRLAEIRAKTFTWKKDAEKKWTKEQEDYLIKTRLKQKQLDKEKLQIEQKPYISSLEEEKAKKAKQKERLSQKQQIYEQSVSSCFPELTENVKNGNTSSKIDILQVVEKDILDSKPYEDVEKDALIYIKNHPFEMKFNWIQFLKEAHIRERRLQEGIIQGYLSST